MKRKKGENTMKKIEKYTKSDKLTDIKAILATVETTEYDIAALTEFVEAEIAALARKSEKAKEKAAEKKTERDELCELVASLLTTEPQTRDQLAEQIDDPEVTVAKVQARLTKLVDAGDVIRTEVDSVSASGKKSTKKAYALPSTEDAE
jgi:hypothetical protein